MIEIPKAWLSTHKSNQGQYYRRVTLLPNSQGSLTTIAISENAGLYFFRFSGFNNMPDYWQFTYLTGIEEDKSALLRSAVAKLAAIEILNLASNNIIGPGYIGQTLSLDGLSQSIQTAKSSATGAFGYLTTQYANDLQNVILPALKSYYRGILMTTL